MTYPRFIKIFSTILLSALAFYTSTKGLFFTLVSIFSLGLFLYYYIFKSQIDFWLQNKGWKSLHWFESLANGGVKEAQIYRALSEFERQILGYDYLETKNKNFDLDQRSPVFRIIGELERSGEGEKEVAQVRGFKLSKDNSTDQKYQLFNAGALVGIEFSPFSKKVWETYAVIGDKRVWQMDFPEKSVTDIRDGRRTVDLRAPYGNHNLDQIKVGEYITFSDRYKLVNATVRIERISNYKSLEEAISAEKSVNILPDSESEIAAVKYFNNLPSYQSRVHQSGVYAIKFHYETPQEITNMLR